MHTPISVRLRCCQAAILLVLIFSRSAAAAPQVAGQLVPAASPAQTPVDLRAERYSIDVTFEPERGFLRARASVTLVTDQILKAIEIELNPHLAIKSVQDAESRALQFDRSDRMGSPKVSVRLAEPSRPGERFELTFTYEGVLPRGALDYITKDGILLRDESRWYPAVDLAAFTQNQITIRVPHRWLAFSSGEAHLGPGTVDSDAVIWKTQIPVSSRSVAAIPATEWTQCKSLQREKTENSSLPVWVNFCTPTQWNNSLAPFMHRTQGAIHRFSPAFGQYPNQIFHIVEGFPGAHGSIGYSAPGFLVVSPDVIKYRDISEYAPEFLPHELAHQWFPIDVTIQREEDGWLAESIAEYLAWRFLQQSDPEAARRMVASAMRDSLAPDPVRPLSLGLKLFALEPWSVTHATLYQRGMLVFRTLETVIDRERVDRALAEYCRRYHGRSASIADFRKICEEIAGRDLGWFFDYFLNGTRIPEIELRQMPSGAPGIAAGEIVVNNMPPEATVRVEMRLRTAKGVVEHSVATRGEVTPFSVNVPAPAVRIELDPDARILRWTASARRYRAQQALLQQVGPLEQAGGITRALELCRQALALDPEDAALNQQRIRFLMGRLELQLKIPRAQTSREFQAVLDGHSIDPVETDFYRAWARVYRARMAKSSARPAAVRAEAEAGLALLAPALDERVTWNESRRREISAREALLELAK